jgi:UDP-N-acetylglucosamine--N-acetylmuramyl-(pentapeptide) pyrophosphoryl-undecaprenol N-acetylglucosamine transferase
LRHKVQTVGNPIRTEIANLPAPEVRMQQREIHFINLLVLGGSQGALAINQVLPNALMLLPPDEKPAIWHQTGKRNFQDTESAYQMGGLSVRLDMFIEDMAQAYAWADLIVCRAGASTVTELMGSGVASILIPYPHSVDHHQLINAEYLEKAGAAMVIPQRELTATHLADILQSIMKDRKKLLAMGEAARNLYKANAAEKVADVCFKAVERIENKNARKLDEMD